MYFESSTLYGARRALAISLPSARSAPTQFPANTTAAKSTTRKGKVVRVAAAFVGKSAAGPDANTGPVHLCQGQLDSRQIKNTGRRLLWKLASIIGLAVGPAWGDQTGSLAGHVIDAESGQSVGWTTVVIEGLERARMSDAEGYFFFANVPLCARTSCKAYTSATTRLALRSRSSPEIPPTSIWLSATSPCT